MVSVELVPLVLDMFTHFAPLLEEVEHALVAGVLVDMEELGVV